jgi:hypothetical protein
MQSSLSGMREGSRERQEKRQILEGERNRTDKGGQSDRRHTRRRSHKCISLNEWGDINECEWGEIT